MSSGWGFDQKDDAFTVESDNSFNEASLLKLNIDKALFHLNGNLILITKRQLILCLIGMLIFIKTKKICKNILLSKSMTIKSLL